MFRTVIKIRKIQFTQFLHTSASKFFIRALPRYYMLQPILDILFYIALLSNKILVLLGLDFREGNSKFQRPKIPARSVILIYLLLHQLCVQVQGPLSPDRPCFSVVPKAVHERATGPLKGD